MLTRGLHRAIVSVMAKMFEPGDRVYRWWNSGAFGYEIQPLTVIRLNRLTVTVRTDVGNTFRIPYEDIVGPYTEE